jgi:hypothetical protein
VEKEEQEEDVNKILIFENECVPHPIQAKSVSSSGVENEVMMSACLFLDSDRNDNARAKQQ